MTVPDDLVERVAQQMAETALVEMGMPELVHDPRYIGRLELAGVDLRKLARAAILETLRGLRDSEVLSRAMANELLASGIQVPMPSVADRAWQSALYQLIKEIEANDGS